MVPEKFRRQLRQESEQWWTEGLIDAELYEKLAHRYQFQQLEQDASNRFIAILLGLGSILLGLGAITFVAANWQDWSRTVKVIVLLTCFLGVNVAGFYFWQQPAQKGWRRLGQGLLLLGALLLGANMALMSQLFHQSGQTYELFLIWGLGVVCMAYGLRFAPLGVLALILVAISYCTSWIGPSWGNTNWQEFSGVFFLIQHMPLLLSLVFIPLGYWCRSQGIIVLSAIAIAISFVFNSHPVEFLWGAPLTTGWLVAMTFVVPPALLWSYREPGPRDRTAQTGARTPMTVPSLAQPAFQTLALWFIAILFYFFSFRGVWDVWSLPSINWLRLVKSYFFIDATLLGSIAVLGWVRIGNPFQARYWQGGVINTAAIASCLVISAALFAWGGSAGVIGILVFNLLLFLLALGLIRDGLALGDRGTFWGGMILLILGIISRMLEYDTGLLLKSIVFGLCGIGIIFAGLNFERTLRSRPLKSRPDSSLEGTP